MARAFCVKAILGLECTRDLIERLEVDSKLRRICGFSLWHKLPSEVTFSRAFSEFAKDGLAEKAHAAMFKASLGEHLIGSISRDATAIFAREKPKTSEKKYEEEKKQPRKRGRPSKEEQRDCKSRTVIEMQRTQSLEEIVAQLPKHCARGTKKNAKGYKGELEWLQSAS